MLTGYNTDVEHDGQTFHVQTEDKGVDNPLIETLIYVGGEILEARKTSYAGGEETDMTPEHLSQLVERQHQRVILDIRLGKYDPPEKRVPFGQGVISDRSFDEVVKDFMQEEEDGAGLPEPPQRPRGS